MTHAWYIRQRQGGFVRSAAVLKPNAYAKIKQRNEQNEAADGIIRIKREKKGRKGKTVTMISGFRENYAEQKKIASELKNRCGTGGSVKDGVIIIQGDHRETVKDELTKQGFKVKLAGG